MDDSVDIKQFLLKFKSSKSQGCNSGTDLQVFSSRTKQEVVSHELDVVQKCPQEGWAEEDPQEILSAISQCIERVVELMSARHLHVSDIVAVGVTNQRETTVVWDKDTGEPLYNAICK